MIRSVLACLAMMAFFDFGSEAFSSPAGHTVKPPAIRLLRSATRRTAGHTDLSMKGNKDNTVDRRAALLSLVFAGAGFIFNPKIANSAGAPLSTKEAEEYARLLEEVANQVLHRFVKTKLTLSYLAGQTDPTPV
jgi:hypothetical protein